MKRATASTVKVQKCNKEFLQFLETITPLVLNRKAINRLMSKVGRDHCKANGLPTKGLTGRQCWELSNMHMRAFLGMDRPNVFTGTK